MRIDVVTIFPDYLDPLRQSLPGKAIDAGIIDAGGARSAALDPRRAPVGRRRAVRWRPRHGDEGAGVGRSARRNLLGRNASGGARRPRAGCSPRPTPQRWSTEKHLVFACGRYEGIDQRVVDDAARRMRVEEVSIGDYVLPGGESAALVMIEAVVRLLPDVLGNPASHQDDSHSDGLAGGAELHPAAELAWTRRAGGAAVRRPREDRGVATRTGAAAHPGAPARPAGLRARCGRRGTSS